MAPGKCRECGAKVSAEAKTCPHCGVDKPIPEPAPKAKPEKSGCAVVIGIFGGVALLLTFTALFLQGQQNVDDNKQEEQRRSTLTPEQRAAEDKSRAQRAAAAEAKKTADEKVRLEREALSKDVGLAEIACQIAAEGLAHDPSSIKWLYDERTFSFTAANQSRATSIQPMRAKNALGATVRTSIKCDLRKESGSWQVRKAVELK